MKFSSNAQRKAVMSQYNKGNSKDSGMPHEVQGPTFDKNYPYIVSKGNLKASFKTEKEAEHFAKLPIKKQKTKFVRKPFKEAQSFIQKKKSDKFYINVRNVIKIKGNKLIFDGLNKKQAKQVEQLTFPAQKEYFEFIKEGDNHESAYIKAVDFQ